MNTIKLTIPNMKSTHCQLTVSSTVEGVGAKVIAVLPGEIELDLGDGLSRETVVAAVEKKGYRVV